VKPGLDDKILLGWNALMITACCKAYAATDEPLYLDLAKRNIGFIEYNFKDHEGNWYHTWKENQSKFPAFLDDLAFLAQAYIHLQEVTGDVQYLFAAKRIVEHVIDGFSEEDALFFYFTPGFQDDIIVRKKEMYDGAIPSGNAVMAFNMMYLAIVFDKRVWSGRLEKMLMSLDKVIVRYPGSFGVWAGLVQCILAGINEIAVLGQDTYGFVKAINRQFIPNKIIQSSVMSQNEFPLFVGKSVTENETTIYLCRDYVCSKPVRTIEELN